MEKMEKDKVHGRPAGGGHPGGGHPGGSAPAGGGRPGGIDTKAIVDISEKGARGPEGRLTLNKRLFMQLLVFTNVKDSAPVIKALADSGIESVLYESLNDPDGVGLLTMSENPDFFVTEVRDFIKNGPLALGRLEPEYTMFGRTYSIGYEDNLEHLLLKRSRSYAKNKAWPWVIWYPLRRSGEFAKLTPKDQGAILQEHGVIGRAFGEAGLAHDIRLASFGLDKNDNDFVIGLLGDELYPLSKIVQTMRGTKQTSTYIEKLGPFFIGKAVWQSPEDL